MVMQDGGAVDVRPGPDPGRAAAGDERAYRTAGAALALYGCALTAWTVYGIVQGDGSLWDFFEGLFNPRASFFMWTLGPGEWALVVALLAVAAGALALRRVARTGALLLGWVMLAQSAREAVGLCHAGYRQLYAAEPLGGWVLATRVLGLLAALVVVVSLLRADGRAGAAGAASSVSSASPSSPPPVSSADGGGRGARPGGTKRSCADADSWWRRRLSRICGVLFLVMGAARLAWTAWGMAEEHLDLGSYLRRAVDGSVNGGAVQLSQSGEFTTLSSVAVLLVLGVLAVRSNRDVRGALLVFAAVELYLTVRTVVLLTVTGFFGGPFVTGESAVSLVMTAYELAATTSVVVLATGRSFSAYGAYESRLSGPYGGGSHRSWPDGRAG
ncbi:hypothetical protein A6A06_04980 [Streptomyces sp. CB02923]|uniref:hypothetical protein n=1 Tax=Streptomyces sp. CB02923 TaxID=1718985 RepID=UPI00093CFD93|nr:hypothetical protein [Streptomyces sp. CB02923]OKI09974.1 hypothetical protein A6A06_04980 [Streptomyces sp. CB02923]